MTLAPFAICLNEMNSDDDDVDDDDVQYNDKYNDENDDDNDDDLNNWVCVCVRLM